MSNFDFVVKNGSTYMLNKETGDLFLISGSAYIRLRESTPPEQTNSPVSEWIQNLTIPSGTNNGSVKVSFKHKWGAGSMDYIFTAVPFDDSFTQELNSGNTASFELRFYDSDGFQKRSMWISLTQADFANDNGKLVVVKNSSIPCSFDDYQGFTLWSITWRGYIPTLPASPTSLPWQSHNPLNDAESAEFVKQLFSTNAGMPVQGPNGADELNRKIDQIQNDLNEVKSKLGVGQ